MRLTDIPFFALGLAFHAASLLIKLYLRVSLFVLLALVALQCWSVGQIRAIRLAHEAQGRRAAARQREVEQMMREVEVRLRFAVGNAAVLALESTADDAGLLAMHAQRVATRIRVWARGDQ